MNRPPTGLIACIALVTLSVGLATSCTLLPPRPSWKLPPPPPREAPVLRPGALFRMTLGNGAHVLILEDHRLPRVALGITARRGAGSVEPERAGLASFTAELMKRGGGDYDALTLAQAVDRIGASLSVGATWDSMTVRISGLSRDLDLLVDILADVTLRPHFESAEAETARTQQLATLERAKDNPATLVDWHTMRTLYPHHRYGRPLSGTPDTVRTLDASKAAALHRRVFIPNNAVLFASGDISAEDYLQRVRKAFGTEHWPRGDVPRTAPPPPENAPPSRQVVLVNRPDLVQARIVIAHEGIARSDRMRVAAQLLNHVLGGAAFSSRLMGSVRAERGLTYSVRSGFAMRRTPGPFRVSTFTRVAEVRRTVDLLLDEVERIRTFPPTDDELTKVKSYAVGRFGLELETSDAVLSSLVSLDVYDLPQDSLDTYRSRVRVVDTAETAAVARQLLHPERASIIVVGPSEKLIPQLEGLGPVVVVEP